MEKHNYQSEHASSICTRCGCQSYNETVHFPVIAPTLYDLYYNEGFGTPEYLVLTDATAQECDAYQDEFSNAHVGWLRVEIPDRTRY